MFIYTPHHRWSPQTPHTVAIFTCKCLPVHQISTS